MSKSLGNSPDPIQLMEKYGADGVRVGMLLCSPAGGDLLFDESLTEQGRNFGNKIWNAFRLVNSWEVDSSLEQPEESKIANKWFNEKLNESLTLLEDQFSKYRLSEALMNVYKLFWDEFSGWYLEIIKPEYKHSIDVTTKKEAFYFLEKLMKLLHPFIPFITEEIWQKIEARNDGESIMTTEMPVSETYEKACVERFEKAKETISSIRTIRKEKEIPNKEVLSLLVLEDEEKFDNRFGAVVKKLCNLSDIQFVENKPERAVSFIVKTTQFYIPLGDKVNVEAELVKLNKELEYNKGFLSTVMKKLGNERFVQNAPESVINKEKEKKEDAEARIQTIEKRIHELTGA